MHSLSLRNISSSEENMNIYQGPDLALANHVPEVKY